jgi:cell division protein FtsB
MSDQITGASLLAMRSLAAQATDSAITTQGNLDALARQYAELKAENLKLREEIEAMQERKGEREWIQSY